MNKNAEQTSTRGFHPGSFFIRFSFLITSDATEVLLFSWWQGARNTNRGKRLKIHLPHKYPLQHIHKTKEMGRKKNTDIWSRYLHSSHSFSRPQLQTYIYLSTHFLFFHLQCPFGSLLATTPQNSALVPTVLTQRVAVSYKRYGSMTSVSQTCVTL